jgi:clan AA aspartic protease
MSTRSLTSKSAPMGHVRADFVITNYFRDKQVSINALVDTGATEIIVTAAVARALGFDLEEVSRIPVIVADGRRISVPRLRGVELHFGDRSFCSEALVLGEECRVGVVPLEVMDLVIDPKNERLIPNPAHPDGPLLRA